MSMCPCFCGAAFDSDARAGLVEKQLQDRSSKDEIAWRRK